MSADFVAQIHLLPTESGGRKGPLISGEWRTVLGVNNEKWSARLAFAGEPSPGETFLSQVQLLRPELALQYFRVGTEFTVWEGGTKGVGKVVSATT
jgi:hypothetical protein